MPLTSSRRIEDYSRVKLQKGRRIHTHVPINCMPRPAKPAPGTQADEILVSADLRGKSFQLRLDVLR